jgi:glycyl-tRNA synthetase
MQGCGSGDMQAALRGGLAVARQALPVQRLIGGSKALRSITTICQLPGQGREGSSTPSQRAGLASSRALPRAAAVEAPTASSAAANGEHKAAASAPSFQEAIARLQEYWAGVGCALWLPHNTEVRRFLHLHASQHTRKPAV